MTKVEENALVSRERLREATRMLDIAQTLSGEYANGEVRRLLSTAMRDIEGAISILSPRRPLLDGGGHHG
jgi:hypothetical protein